METGISHSRDEETPEAKARWFQSLTLEQRMDLLCQFSELALSVNPDLPWKKDAEPIEGRVLVVSRAQR